MGPNIANQMRHFGDQIGINHGPEPREPINDEPKVPNNYGSPQQIPHSPLLNPNTNPSTFYLSLSPWIIAIGVLLGVILICNIVFMCYINCCNDGERGTALFGRRKGYLSVNVDSDF